MRMSDGKTALDAQWTQWLRHCMNEGVDLSELLVKLRQAGFTDEAIAAGFDAVRPTNDATEQVRTPPLLRRNPPKLRKFEDPRVDLYTLEDFLSRKECERLIALSAHHLSPSSVAFYNGDRYFRTSSSCYLSHLKSPVAQGIDDKICRTLGIRPEYAEAIQAQRYEVGQEFKPHWDYFEPDTNEYLRFCGTRGNRTWTFMVYLNDGMEGGGTRFTELGHTFKPKLGMAVLWNNLNADGTPNKATMHAGEPVISGHKVIITKWFRALGDGPVFFN